MIKLVEVTSVIKVPRIIRYIKVITGISLLAQCDRYWLQETVASICGGYWLQEKVAGIHLP